MVIDESKPRKAQIIRRMLKVLPKNGGSGYHSIMEMIGRFVIFMAPKFSITVRNKILYVLSLFSQSFSERCSPDSDDSDDFDVFDVFDDFDDSDDSDDSDGFDDRSF